MCSSRRPEWREDPAIGDTGHEEPPPPVVSLGSTEAGSAHPFVARPQVAEASEDWFSQVNLASGAPGLNRPTAIALEQATSSLLAQRVGLRSQLETARAELRTAQDALAHAQAALGVIQVPGSLAFTQPGIADSHTVSSGILPIGPSDSAGTELHFAQSTMERAKHVLADLELQAAGVEALLRSVSLAHSPASPELSALVDVADLDKVKQQAASLADAAGAEVDPAHIALTVADAQFNQALMTNEGLNRASASVNAARQHYINMLDRVNSAGRMAQEIQELQDLAQSMPGKTCLRSAVLQRVPAEGATPAAVTAFLIENQKPQSPDGSPAFSVTLVDAGDPVAGFRYYEAEGRTLEEAYKAAWQAMASGDPQAPASLSLAVIRPGASDQAQSLLFSAQPQPNTLRQVGQVLTQVSNITGLVAIVDPEPVTRSALTLTSAVTAILAAGIDYVDAAEHGQNLSRPGLGLTMAALASLPIPDAYYRFPSRFQVRQVGPEWVPFRQGFDQHVTGGPDRGPNGLTGGPDRGPNGRTWNESFSPDGTLSGTHNYAHAMAAVAARANGLQVDLSRFPQHGVTWSVGNPGIGTYRYPLMYPIPGRVVVEFVSKTVYNPNLLPDERMLFYAQNAAGQVWNRYRQRLTKDPLWNVVSFPEVKLGLKVYISYTGGLPHVGTVFPMVLKK